MTHKTARNRLPLLSAGLGAALIVTVLAIVVVSSLGAPTATPGATPSGGPVGAVPTPSAPLASLAVPAPSSAAATPAPTISATPVPASPPSSGEPSAAPSSAPTPAPSSPVESPSPTPAATARPTPTAQPTERPATRFSLATGFSSGETVYAITGGGPGFVAIGWHDNPTEECEYREDGRIWTSADGLTWTRRDSDALADVRLFAIVNRADTLYAFGYAGNDECPGLPREDLGNNVWRSSDGIAWEQITNGMRFHSPYDRWNDVALAGDTFVAVGRRGEAGDEEVRGGVWLSEDGIAWSAAERPPATYEMVTVAARGETIVAFGSDSADGLAWFARDGGRTWQQGTLAGGWLPYGVDLVATVDGFVAVTSACCGLPHETVGIDYHSTDGATWTPGTDFAQRGARGALLSGGGILTVTDGGDTRLSSDGRDWRVGPTGPALDSNRDFIYALGAAPAGVALAVNRDDRVEVWFAPASELQLTAWTEQPARATRPIVGQAYRYSLYTHCGTENVRVVFDGSVWIVEAVESGPFRDPGERGEVTMLDHEHARYANRRGGSLLLRRTEVPPPWPRCA